MFFYFEVILENAEGKEFTRNMKVKTPKFDEYSAMWKCAWTLVTYEAILDYGDEGKIVRIELVTGKR